MYGCNYQTIGDKNDSTSNLNCNSFPLNAMKTTRRTFVKRIAAGTGALSVLRSPALAKDTHPTDQSIEKAAARPVLSRDVFKEIFTFFKNKQETFISVY